MGTAHDWMLVVIAGSFWGGFLGFFGWRAFSERFAKPSRHLATLYCLLYAFAGLAYGVGQTFGNRSFHPPLLILQVVNLACGLVLGFYLRKVAGQHARLPRYSTDAPLFGGAGQPKSFKS